MSSQAVLFKNIDVKKFDATMTELHNLIFAMKHFALLIETSDSKNKPFMCAVDCAREIATLCDDLQDLSLKYLDVPPGYWKKMAVYSPYYAALEPRSPFRLYEIALDYKSRSNAILLRLEAILRAGSIVVPKQIGIIRKSFAKLASKLHDQKFEL